MATNLNIDPQLLNEALRIGGLPTKCATVTEALKDFIAKHAMQNIIDMKGTIDYYDDEVDKPLVLGKKDYWS